MKKLLMIWLSCCGITVFAADNTNPTTIVTTTTTTTNYSSESKITYVAAQESMITLHSQSVEVSPQGYDPLSNIYVGISAGGAWNNIASPAAAYRGEIGYNIIPYLAIELGTSGITQSGGNPIQSMQAYDVSVKGILPLGNVVSLYAQLGAAYLVPGALAGNVGGTNLQGQTYSWYQSGVDAMTGVGIDFNVSKSISLDVKDIAYYGGSQMQGNTNLVLAGINFKF